MNVTGIGWILALAGTALGLGQIAPPTGLRIVTPCGVMTPGSGPTLLRDDFNGSALDGAKWEVPAGKGTFIGQTQIRPPAEPIAVANCAARLRLDTFNPTALKAGDSFWGSEIDSRQSFSRDLGLIFRARVRLAGGSVPGMVASFFSYVTRTNGAGQALHDEIDFELLTKDVARNMVLTNVYNDDPVNTPGRPEHGTRAGLDLTAFNEYEVRWLPDRVQWRVNGVQVREDVRTVPDESMTIRLNFWVPDSGFRQAYDPALQTAKTRDANRTYYYEVDWVEVTRP